MIDTANAPDCRYCLDEGIVCEAHPDTPWEGTLGEAEGGCGCSPGMPCPHCCSPVPEDGTHAIAEAFVPDRRRLPEQGAQA